VLNTAAAVINARSWYPSRYDEGTKTARVARRRDSRQSRRYAARRGSSQLYSSGQQVCGRSWPQRAHETADNPRPRISMPVLTSCKPRMAKHRRSVTVTRTGSRSGPACGYRRTSSRNLESRLESRRTAPRCSPSALRNVRGMSAATASVRNRRPNRQRRDATRWAIK